MHLTHQILRALKEGWYPLTGFGPVPIGLFLAGLRAILRILSSRFGMEWRMWIDHAAGFEPQPTGDHSGTPLRYFERLDGPVRERLLAEASYLLDEWPNQFLDSIHATGLRGSFALEQRARKLPFWLLSGIQDPHCRMRFPLAPFYPFPERRVGHPTKERTHLSRSNTFEKIAFIQDHPEWSEDIPQLARAMVDFGLYASDHPVSKIDQTCRSHLSLVARHAAHGSTKSGPYTITGFRARLVAQRHFLSAFKLAIAKRIGL